MKCNYSFSLFSYLCILIQISIVVSESESGQPNPEHRGANPEPFFDKIASFFGVGPPGNRRPQEGLIHQASAQRPLVATPPRPFTSSYDAPRPLSPSYNAPRPITSSYDAPRPYNPGYDAPRPLAPNYDAPKSPTSSFGPPPPSNPSYNGSPKPPLQPPLPPPRGPTGYKQPPIQTKFPNSDLSGFGGPTDSISLPWQSGSIPAMAQIQDLQVHCEKNLMRVKIIFDRPFYGLIFSKGHFSTLSCIHVPAGLGQTQITFDISLQSCGTVNSVNLNNLKDLSGPTPQGSFIENTIVVQYDPLLQEVWDLARKLRCTWYDYYEKPVTFKPFQVDLLDPVTANFLGDNLRCWMQIQVGKGPYASEVSGIIKIGQTMTIVLGVKDDDKKFDMMVRNCVAHDGKKSPIQLVDHRGCVVRPKIMSPFRKVKNFDETANVLAYAYFQAFKFPDSMNVHFQCVVQVCRGTCPDAQCEGGVVNTDISPPLNGNIVNGAGTPQLPVTDSYGSPLADPLFSVKRDVLNPRISIDKRTFEPNSFEDDEEEEDIEEQEMDTQKDNKRENLGNRPRSLELENVNTEKPQVDENEVKNNTLSISSTKISNQKQLIGKQDGKHQKRSASESNNIRISKVVKRDTAEIADVETTEKVIQVLAPNDVQFTLPTDDNKQEVVINAKSSAHSVCIDVSALIGVTVTFLMFIIVAIIIIVFLWVRIKMFYKEKMLLP